MAGRPFLTCPSCRDPIAELDDVTFTDHGVIHAVCDPNHTDDDEWTHDDGSIGLAEVDAL